MRLVILCGGSGSRLWPESRSSLPKQFISILNKKSLLDLTVERVLKIIQNSKPIFICSKNHGFLVKRTIDKYKLNADVFLEPEGKSTCAAIYLAAKYCANNENLVIIPSDHLIPDSEKFIEDVSKIERDLTQRQWITLGVKPTKPSNSYGYIQVSNSTKKNPRKVIKFIEKPSIKVASEFIKQENYFWNAGIFIANTSKIICSVKEHAPDIAHHCDKVLDEIKINTKKNEINFPSNLFSQIPARSIDYAVMEYEKDIFLYPFEGKWNDVGSWDSIAEILKEKSSKRVVQIDSDNNFIRSKKRIIATIGVKDLIIVDSDDATLISKKNETEKVKKVINKLVKKNFVEANEHTFEKRPWGKFENLFDEEICKVKKITINPQKRLSLQYHNFRSEHWLVVEGKANIHLDGKNLVLEKGESIDIPIKSHHYIENSTNSNLIIIETQLGTYFGEDDILRLDDPYDR